MAWGTLQEREERYTNRVTELCQSEKVNGLVLVSPNHSSLSRNKLTHSACLLRFDLIFITSQVWEWYSVSEFFSSHPRNVHRLGAENKWKQVPSPPSKYVGITLNRLLWIFLFYFCCLGFCVVLFYCFVGGSKCWACLQPPLAPCNQCTPIPRGPRASEKQVANGRKNGTNDPQPQSFVSRSIWWPLPDLWG